MGKFAGLNRKCAVRSAQCSAVNMLLARLFRLVETQVMLRKIGLIGRKMDTCNGWNRIDDKHEPGFSVKKQTRGSKRGLSVTGHSWTQWAPCTQAGEYF